MRENFARSLLFLFLFFEMIVGVFCIFSMILVAATETLAAEHHPNERSIVAEGAKKALLEVLPSFERFILDNYEQGVFEVRRSDDGQWHLFPLSLSPLAPHTVRTNDTQAAQDAKTTLLSLPISLMTQPLPQQLPETEDLHETYTFAAANDYHDVLSAWHVFKTCGARFIATDDDSWDYVVGLSSPPGYWYHGSTSGFAMASWEECGVRDGYILVEIRWYGIDLSWSGGSNPPTSIPVNEDTQKGIFIRSFPSERRSVELSWCFPDTVTGYITKRRLQVLLFVPYRRAEEGGYYLLKTRYSSMIYDEIAPPACVEE